MSRRIRPLLVAIVLVAPFGKAHVRADIKNWQTGETIPGTQGVDPGPGVNLSHRNTEQRNLRFADFAGLNLSGAGLSCSWLDYGKFTEANLTAARLDVSTLANSIPLPATGPRTCRESTCRATTSLAGT